MICKHCGHEISNPQHGEGKVHIYTEQDGQRTESKICFVGMCKCKDPAE